MSRAGAKADSLAAVTWRLALQGIAVLCIEQGEWFAHDALDPTAADWERQRRGDWNANPNIRRAAACCRVRHNPAVTRNRGQVE
jgi:hypothetical protein